MTNLDKNERPEGYETVFDTSSIVWRDFFIKALDRLNNEASAKGGLNKVSKDTIKNFKKNSGGFILNMSCQHPLIKKEAIEKIKTAMDFVNNLDDNNPLKSELFEILISHDEKLSMIK